MKIKTILFNERATYFRTLRNTSNIIGHLSHELLDFGNPFETGRKSVRDNNIPSRIGLCPLLCSWIVRPLKIYKIINFINATFRRKILQKDQRIRLPQKKMCRFHDSSFLPASSAGKKHHHLRTRYHLLEWAILSHQTWSLTLCRSLAAARCHLKKSTLYLDKYWLRFVTLLHPLATNVTWEQKWNFANLHNCEIAREIQEVDATFTILYRLMRQQRAPTNALERGRLLTLNIS